MSESVNVENKKQNYQKPPLSRRKIAHEILAGIATGLVVALPLACVTGIVLVGKEVDSFASFAVLGIYFLACPMVYGHASAVGVYLVGKRGKQTGSFLSTLVGGFLGGFTILPIFFFANIGIIVLWALVLLIPPIIATIGFNQTRRYKEPQPAIHASRDTRY